MTSRITRLTATFGCWEELLTLIRDAFAPMDGVIDPPSSVHALTAAALRQKALSETAFVMSGHDRLLGCIFCRPEADCLYIGKLAVAPDAQRRGLGCRLMKAAEAMARQEGLRSLRLETRIELTDNHAAFRAMGFVKTAENAHPGFTRTTSIEMRKTLA